MSMRSCLFLGFFLSLSACASKPLAPGGERIVVSKSDPPDGCRFLAEVRGSQGNFWTAEFTSDAELIAGARNDLRNAALTLGADYVRIETESYSENTALDSLGGTYAAVIIGNAFVCNNKDGRVLITPE